MREKGGYIAFFMIALQFFVFSVPPPTFIAEIL